MTVPCGKCLGCQKERTKNWGIRAMHETKTHPYNTFITLSYKPKHLPKNAMLEKEHFVLFMKRFRKSTRQKIRYLMCGEYGDKYLRPHYHALIFGYEFQDMKFHKLGKNGDPLYISEKLESLWGLGFCIIGRVSFASSQYVAKYINTKNIYHPQQEKEHYIPPYNTSSRRPGLGIPWLEKYWKDVYPADQVIMDGGKYKPPRAYDKWLEENHQKTFQEVKNNRRKAERKKIKLDDAELDMQGIAREAIIAQKLGVINVPQSNPRNPQNHRIYL